jgi:DNA-binding transcriptional regulator GbsR (MarR family)
MALDIVTFLSDISVMTEISDITKRLPPVIERFVLHWGDMGSHWGVNRSVSQIHALLYLAERPLTADDIAATLGIARSNVSNSIKELLAWNLIRRVPMKGDRRDHFEAETDIWEVFLRIAAGRKEREIDPALATLKACVSEAEHDQAVPPIAARRLGEMLRFVEMMERWYTQMLNVPKTKLSTLIRLGSKVLAFLPQDKTNRRQPM